MPGSLRMPATAATGPYIGLDAMRPAVSRPWKRGITPQVAAGWFVEPGPRVVGCVTDGADDGMDPVDPVAGPVTVAPEVTHVPPFSQMVPTAWLIS